MTRVISTSSGPLHERVARAVSSAASTSAAEAEVGRTIEDAFVGKPASSAKLPEPAPGLTPIVATSEGVRALEVALAVRERRLEQVLRAVRRESTGRNSCASNRVLAYEAIRTFIEAATLRRLTADVGALTTGTLDATVTAEVLGRANRWNRLLVDESVPRRHGRLASEIFAQPAVKSSSAAASAASLSRDEATALIEILSANDPAYGAGVRERVQRGEDLGDVRAMLFERLVPVDLESAPLGEIDRTKVVDGLLFDLSTNTWVQKDRSWAYPLPLSEVLNYEVDGIIDGRHELKARLVAAAIDPVTGDPGISVERIERFVDQLADAFRGGDPTAVKLLSARFDMCFATTDGGDTPVSAIWEIPRAAVADLFAALADDKTVADISFAASEFRAKDAAERAERMKPLAGLLAKYTGEPERHKRAHGALINLGLAGVTVTEMGRDGSVLPRSETTLTPATLGSRYADAQQLKMRYLISEDFELAVISDETFQKVVDKYHFPPNHELLSYNRRIAGSGYLTVDKGVIVALEDDIVMLPGKLPENLPPAIEVLKLGGYRLDEQAIAKSSRVVDFEFFTKRLKKDTVLPAAPAGSTDELRRAFEDCTHSERPALIAALIVEQLRACIAQGLDLKAAEQKVATTLPEVLGEFRIFNTSTRDFRNGNLPADRTEFDALMIDASLAPALVRKVLPCV